jgi:hypothetical protein
MKTSRQYLSDWLSIYLSIYLFMNLSIFLRFYTVTQVSDKFGMIEEFPGGYFRHLKICMGLSPSHLNFPLLPL